MSSAWRSSTRQARFRAGADRGEGAAQRSGRATDEDGRDPVMPGLRPVARKGVTCVRGAIGRTRKRSARRHQPSPRSTGWLGCPARGELADQRGERGGTRLGGAHVEGSGLVVAAALAEQGVPVERAQQRPGRHGADVGTGVARGFRGVPDLEQPAKLVFAVGIDVGFGHRQRDAVALPRLAQQRCDRRRRRRQNADRLDVDEFIGTQVTRTAARIAIEPMVQPALARHVVVDADDVGRAGMR